VVALDGVADSVTPGIRTESVDVFVLGDVDGLQEGLEHVGDGAGSFGFYFATEDGGNEARQGGAEIAGAGLGFLLGVVEAEVGMGGDARGAAAAAVGEDEQTQGYAVLSFKRRHKNLLRFESLGLVAVCSGASSSKSKRSSVVSFQFSVREEKVTRKLWDLEGHRQDALR
jgi:hypothetical protein